MDYQIFMRYRQNEYHFLCNKIIINLKFNPPKHQTTNRPIALSIFLSSYNDNDKDNESTSGLFALVIIKLLLF